MTPLREQLSGDLRQPMLLVLGAVAVVQLIACGNLANLLLARGATRAQELAVRHALGASRAQIVRHLLGESLVIGLAGSACGILLTVWGLDLMRAAFPTELPYWVRFDFDWRICLCAIVTGLISTLLFGAFPAFRCSHPDLLTDLKRGGGSTPGCGKTERTRNSLVVAQIALTMVLLIGASLMLRSLLKLQSIAIGIDPSNTLTFRIGLPQPEFPTAATQARFFEQLTSKLVAMPGVEAAGASNALPGTGASRRSVFVDAAAGASEPQEARAINAVTITPAFLRAARIPLLRGRDFTPADNENAARVVIIDEEAARAWFPDQEAIGRRVAAVPKPNEPPQWATIIGVAGNVAYDVSLRRRPHPAIYFPHAQTPQPFMAVALRTKTDPTALVTSAREVVLSVHKGVPIHAVETMDEVLARAFWRQKFFGALFAVFATVAVLLAAIGLYGLVAYAVRQRTREIGVRVALGARRRDVFRLITGYGLRLIAIGLVIGSVAAFFLSPLLAPNLHGILPHDLVSFTAVPVLLLTIGLLASYLPTKAAMRLSPIEALRHE